MAGLDNPFERFFNPDTAQPGTLTGFLARGFPSPSAGANEEAVRSIMQDIQAGMDPQKAVVKFFSSPAGAHSFVTNPNIMATIENSLKQITAPPLQEIQTAPGASTETVNRQTGARQRYNQPTAENQNFAVQGRVVNTAPGTKTSVLGPNGQINQEITNPATEVQVFQEMGKIAGLPADQLQKYAEANLMVNGRYQVVAEKNSFGEPTGSFAVLDRMTGQLVSQRSSGVGPQQPAPNQPGITTVPRSMLSPDGSVDIPKLTAGKAGMFLGAGFWPQVLGLANSTMGSFVHPSLGIDEGRAANKQRADLEDLRSAVFQFPQVVGRTNKLIDQMTKNLEFGSFTDPLDAVRQGRQFYDDIQGEISSAENTIRDENQPKEVKVSAAREIQAYNRILRNMPTRGEMVELEKAILGNKIPGLGATAATNALVRGGKAAIEAGKNVATGQEPTAAPSAAPVTTAKQGDIATMPPAELAKLNPKSLSPEQRIQLQKRLKDILNGPAR